MNSPEKHSNHQTEDAYRLITTAIIVIIIMAALIRLSAHAFPLINL